MLPASYSMGLASGSWVPVGLGIGMPGQVQWHKNSLPIGVPFEANCSSDGPMAVVLLCPFLSKYLSSLGESKEFG